GEHVQKVVLHLGGGRRREEGANGRHPESPAQHGGLLFLYGSNDEPTPAPALASREGESAAGRSGDYPVLALQALEGGDAHGPAHVVVGGAVTRAVLDELGPLHEAVAVDDHLGAARPDEVVLAAHEDRLLRAGVHAEAAVDAAQEVDLETGGVLL